ncbi:MAG: FAD-dependent oxidoreductase [Gammaproteobacteria bacterium AqS3]|nr:FAD-dependent oxidoreductase [Gammaproteobacteria bacterium AqS3]
MRKRLLLLAFLALLAGLWWYLDLGRYASLGALAEHLETLRALIDRNFALAAGVYFVVYILVLIPSLPGALVLTVAGGVLFGFWPALLLVSFASSIGSLLAMLFARTLLRDWVQRRFADVIGPINRGLEREGALYLFSLRLVPLFPLFAINLVFGLTRFPALRFYWVSQLGMLPVTAVYINAAAQVAQIEQFDAAGVLSWEIIASLALLAVFPFVIRRALGALRTRRALRGARRPRRFDYNLVVIGAGSAGLVSALVGAAVRAKVLLVERNRMGGDCLWTGCVPSKSILAAAAVAHTVHRARDFGVHAGAPEVRFDEVMARVRAAIEHIAPHDSPERFTELGVDCRSGSAEVISPWEVRIGDQVFSARRIIVATGGAPNVPDIAGLDEVPHVTSDTFWSLRELPARLLVLGAGPIGCELAQACARLGSEVHVVGRGERLVAELEEEAAAHLHQGLEADGVSLTLGAEVTRLRSTAEGGVAEIASLDGSAVREQGFDLLLLAAGRSAVLDGLDALNLETEADGSLSVDAHLRTSCPTVYACGDAVGPHRFTHAASHQAWHASVNALFDPVAFKVDHSLIPRCVYTDPEVASLGLSPDAADPERCDVTRYSLEGLDRYVAENINTGYLRIVTAKGGDRILGVTIVGAHAGELLGLFALAMRHKLGLSKILSTVLPYPTGNEAVKLAAGQWRRGQTSERTLTWAERIMRWRR